MKQKSGGQVWRKKEQRAIRVCVLCCGHINVCVRVYILFSPCIFAAWYKRGAVVRAVSYERAKLLPDFPSTSLARAQE